VLDQVFRRFSVADFSPEQARFLAYGRVVDCTRLHDGLGFRPKYSTPDAFADFVHHRLSRGPLDPALLGELEAAFQRGLRAADDPEAAARPDAEALSDGR
jgi:UDP-glucose 4-epimerase